LNGHVHICYREYDEKLVESTVVVRSSLSKLQVPQSEFKLLVSQICLSIFSRVGQNHAYTVYINGNFSMEITMDTVIYSVIVRFKPTLKTGA